MTTDISKEASRPLYGQGSHAHALRERAKAAEWEAERAALRAKHLREEAELAEREERDEVSV